MKSLFSYHSFAIFLLLISLAPLPAADTFSSVYITEFVAINQHGLKDEAGELSPWIELHNGSATTVHLQNWHLTDSPANLTQWSFPAVSLLPDKYMVVFASGRNRTNDLAHLHTSFRLGAQANYLALVNPKTNIVSEFTVGKQAADIAYGRIRGEPAMHGPLPKPTPGKPNPASGPGFAPEVIFSRPSGAFVQPFALQLSCPAPSAVIRYTLDGTLPRTNSPIYSAPLRVTNSSQVRARAFQERLYPGPVQSESYPLLDTNMAHFTSTLPVLVLDTFGREIPTSSRASSVHVSFYEPVQGKTSLTNAPSLVTPGGFRVRGSTSSGMPQSPFAVEFLDEFKQERHLSPLGLPPESDWILYAPNAVDPVMIHNAFIFQLSREIGRYSPRTRFVEVFVVRDSGSVKEAHYQGIYTLEEKIKISRQRVNIDHLGAEDLKPPAVTGGYLLKFDRLGPGEVGLVSSGDRGLVYVEPKELILNLPQRAPQKQYIDSFVSDFDQALHGPQWKDPVLGYRAYLDVEAAIDFHVLEVLSGNVDSMVLSTYFYKPRNGKIICGPHWDFDRSLGSTDGRDDNPRQWEMGHPYFGGAWWPRLFEDPDFWQLWVDRWQALRGSHFSLANLNQLADQLCGQLREAQPRHYRTWGLQPRGGSYQSEIDHMKDWLSNRVDFIDHELVQPPRLNRAEGRVPPGFPLTLAAPTNATIYYTLDGSDPRQSQGAVSPRAIAFTAPIPLLTNVQVMARAWNNAQKQSGGPPISTPWSAPVRSLFLVKP
ncbi:MAG: Por secretion system C-terminal sorting protein [Verrucomicrobiales bacterium]|nr:Por secretion system C-terminal sorting protein [Verrucomicrobiales bacterium]